MIHTLARMWEILEQHPNGTPRTDQRLRLAADLVATAVALRRRVGHLDDDVVEVQLLQHLLGLRIHFNDVLLQSRHLRYVVISALAFLLLQLDGDTTDLRVAQTLHQMCHETSDLVAQGLGGNDGHFLDDALVCVEIHRQPGVVLLNNDLRGLLDGLCTNATHFGSSFAC